MRCALLACESLGWVDPPRKTVEQIKAEVLGPHRPKRRTLGSGAVIALLAALVPNEVTPTRTPWCGAACEVTS